MSQPCPLRTRLVIALFLFCAVMLMTVIVATVGAAPTPVEILFETTSPYYQPRVAVVSAGTPVRWINATASHHSVRHDGCVTDETCAFQSIAVPPDSSFLIAPLPPGRYAYHCELHPLMRGTLIVLDPLVRGDAMISVLEQSR
ncbi:MAG TPA: cupredoxin domain-containing protein [Nitrospiraceae bacterium]|nr:cupredoxin domain-containing protein [Nitrospiraceae bacterium]